MPRPRRFKSTHAAAVYHCISRTVNGEFLFDDPAKEMLRKQMHQIAGFCGIEIITYAVMSNHFHVLVRIPPKTTLDDAELLRRYKILYPKPTQYASAQIEIIEATLKANGPDAQKLREQLLARMGDLSEFMKSLKQRFSIWFNRTHNRFGTLWAERFSSTIIEGGKHHFALQTVAAYIDLNPVRAGLVTDPKDYRWCGYGEALGGGGKMLQGLRCAVGFEETASDDDVLAQYRMVLFGKGSVPKAGGDGAAQLTHEAFAGEQARQGRLPVSERLRLRVSWFTTGAVIGSQQFVMEHLREYRERTRKRLKHGVFLFAPDRGTTWGSLFAMRGGSGK